VAGRGDYDVHPYDDALGVHPRRRPSPVTRSGLGATRPTSTALLHFPYFDLYRKQVVNQATSCSPCICEATPSPTTRRLATSLLRGAHRADSSLSACTRR